MNYEEFKARTTEKASYETFKKYEAMYMAGGDIDKDMFCKLMKPLVVAETESAPYKAEAAEATVLFHNDMSQASVAALDGDMDAFEKCIENARQEAVRRFEAETKVKKIYAKL